VVSAGGKAGTIEVVATSPGLKEGGVKLSVR
jgi:hypothetical protein